MRFERHKRITLEIDINAEQLLSLWRREEKKSGDPLPNSTPTLL